MDRRGSKADERSGAGTASAGSDDQVALLAARGGFATWLRERRVARGQSLEEVAKVTRIQQRTLERLESGRFDELPADVFVRGFIRNYARVVGIDPDEALARYGDCGVAPAPIASMEAQALLEAMAALAPESSAASPTVSAVRALGRARTSAPMPAPIEIEPAVLSVEASVELAPAEPVAEAAPIAVQATVTSEPIAPTRSSSKSRRRARRMAEGTTSPQDDASAQPKSRRRRNRRGRHADAPVVEPVAAAAVDGEARPEGEELEVEIEIVAAPASIAAPIHVAPTHQARPARRPTRVAPTMVLTIDDDDPDSAERTREARAAREDKEPSRRSFLPPVLLDEERSGRQGGLTLAVIILLIVATLTLSYLMRRPSSTGEGITRLQAETATHRVA
jgi:cytoskeletal protein RodZ